MGDAYLTLPLNLGGDGPHMQPRLRQPTARGKARLGRFPPAGCKGCRIVDKANMHELAFGMTGVNGWTGTTANPRDP